MSRKAAKKPNDIEKSIELRRLELEERQFEYQKQNDEIRNQLDAQRLQYEQQKAPSSLTKWLGVAAILGAFLGPTLAAVLNSNAVYRAGLLAFQSKGTEIQRQESLKEKELRFNATKFLLENSTTLSKRSPQEQKFFAGLIDWAIPQEESLALLAKIEKASPPATKLIWREARSKIEASQSEELVSDGDRGVNKTAKEVASPANTESIKSVNNQPIYSGLKDILGQSVSTPYTISATGYVGASVLGEIRLTDALYRPSPTPSILSDLGKSTSAYLNTGTQISFPIGKDNDENKLLMPMNFSLPKDGQKSDALASVISSYTDAIGKPLGETPKLFLTDGAIHSITTPSTSTLVFLQSTTFSGKVFDKETGNPIIQARISTASELDGLRSPVASVTDLAGGFRLDVQNDPVFQNKVKIKITAPGYSAVTLSPQSSNGLLIDLGKIYLEKEAIQ